EYTNAFGSDAWRQSVRNSVNGNYDHRNPPAPEPEQPASPQPQPQPTAISDRTPVAHPFRGEASSPVSTPQAQAQQSTSAPSPHTSLPPTSAEFAQQVV